MGSEPKGKNCEICRAPHAAMPCSRCAMPPPTPPNSRRQSGSQRATHPIKLDGKYQLLEEIGRGGMGTVFRAIDESLDRIVAVKFLLPEIQAVDDAVDLFRREARAMASINHRNVVRVFSFGRYGSADFMVTEYIEGPTLENMIDASYTRGSFIDVGGAMRILSQAAKGLSAVHRSGVVHRDIKPGNVMVESEDSRVLIMDFGIGRRIDFSAEESAVAPRGTPAYMAPEIIESQSVEPSKEHLADLYAFGITAFELLTNRLPFDGGSWFEILEKHLEEPPPQLSDVRSGLPSGLDGVIGRSLEKDPRKRYQTAEAIKDDIDLIARTFDENTPPLRRPSRNG